MACIKEITDNFLRTCTYSPIAGLKQTVYLCNTSEIDKALSQLLAGNMTITDFILQAGKYLFAVEGAGKFPQGKTEVVMGDNGAGWKHSLSVRILYYGNDERIQLQQMLMDGRFTAIIEKKDTGLAGELTYEVLGWNSGLAITATTWDSTANNGVVQVDMATMEGEEEATDRKIYLDTNAANTAADIAAMLYSQV